MRELELSDGVITLSPLCPEDAEAHLAGEDEESVRWLSGGRSTPETVEACLRHCREQWETAGPLHAFGIRAGKRGDLAGTVDLRFVQAYLATGQVNVAYGLHPSWRGRGLATRAVRLACGYVARTGAREAVIRVEPGNGASAAVARRAGFAPDKHTFEQDGTRHDWYLRSLNRPDGEE